MGKYLCIITSTDWYTYVDEIIVVTGKDEAMAKRKAKLQADCTGISDDSVYVTPFSELRTGWTFNVPASD